MYPRLWTIPGIGIPIHSYGLMIMVGFVAASWLAVRRGRRVGMDTDMVLDLAMYLMVSGIVGARLLYLVQFRAQYDWALLRFWDGDMFWPGGLLAAGAYLGWIYKVRARPEGGRTRGRHALHAGVAFLFLLFVARGLSVALAPGRWDFSVFKIWEGGIVFYGGLLAATVVGMLFLRARGVPFLRAGDVVAPSVAIGLAFGRVGCFLNGCCFGTRAEGFGLAVRYPRIPPGGQIQDYSLPYADHLLHHDPAWVTVADAFSLPVHPTQLYAAAAAALLCLALVLYDRGKRREGQTLAMLGVLYPVVRFVLEYFRGDNAREYWGLTMSQSLSVLIFCVSLYCWYRLGRFDTVKRAVTVGDGEAAGDG